MFAACSVKYLQRSTHKPHVHTNAEKLSVSVLDANSRPSSLKSSTAYGHLAWPKPTLESKHGKAGSTRATLNQMQHERSNKTSQKIQDKWHMRWKNTSMGNSERSHWLNLNQLCWVTKVQFKALPGSDKISRTFLPSYWILSDKSSAASQTLCTSISSVTMRLAPQTW